MFVALDQTTCYFQDAFARIMIPQKTGVIRNGLEIHLKPVVIPKAFAILKYASEMWILRPLIWTAAELLFAYCKFYVQGNLSTDDNKP